MEKNIFNASSKIERRDLLQSFGLSEDASQEDIKNAYRKKVVGCHPDLHPGDKAKEEEFKTISAIYARLTRQPIEKISKEEVESWRDSLFRDPSKTTALQAAARELALRKMKAELGKRGGDLK